MASTSLLNCPRSTQDRLPRVEGAPRDGRGAKLFWWGAIWPAPMLAGLGGQWLLWQRPQQAASEVLHGLRPCGLAVKFPQVIGVQ